MTSLNVQLWRDEIEDELQFNILPFWMLHGPDRKHGGFVGLITGDMQVDELADKGLVLHARILWTYASAYRIYRTPAYWTMAEEAYRYLQAYFWDRQYGGYYWLLDHRGDPKVMKKQVYGQAFVIYAYAEFVRAGAGQDVLDEALAMFELLENASRDPVYGGYIEALARDWTATEDLSLSGRDMNEKKSMNTHLHVMEAYTNLYRVAQPDLLKIRLTELIELTLERILDKDQRHLQLFFDEAWSVKSEDISYGHDIEASWLLVEAADVLGDLELLKRTRLAAIRMAKATLEEGVDADGGVINEANSLGWTDTDKIWWVQAEAVVGFWNAYELTKEAEFAEASYHTWRFISRYMVDKEHGEWFWKTDRAGHPDRSAPKADPWKCPYHNGRMCLEMLERLTRESGAESTY